MQIVFVIRIFVPFTSLCQRIAWCLPQARCLCSENVAIGFKTCIEAYFVGKKQRYDAGTARGEQMTPKFVIKTLLQKSPFFSKLFPYCDVSVVISLL